MENQSTVGYLIVSVSTARGAIPLENAAVTVYYEDKENSSVFSSMTTDRSGKTEKISLPAPSRELSETPGNTKPYATYTVAVEKEGYYSVTNVGVPIFDGITSVQPVEMVPLAEYNPDTVYPRYGRDVTEDRDQNL